MFNKQNKTTKVVTRPQFKTYLLTQDQCKPSAVATIQAMRTTLPTSTFQDAGERHYSGGYPKRSLPQWLGANCKAHTNTISFL